MLIGSFRGFDVKSVHNSFSDPNSRISATPFVIWIWIIANFGYNWNWIWIYPVPVDLLYPFTREGDHQGRDQVGGSRSLPREAAPAVDLIMSKT